MNPFCITCSEVTNMYRTRTNSFARSKALQSYSKPNPCFARGLETNQTRHIYLFKYRYITYFKTGDEYPIKCFKNVEQSDVCMVENLDMTKYLKSVSILPARWTVESSQLVD